VVEVCTRPWRAMPAIRHALATCAIVGIVVTPSFSLRAGDRAKLREIERLNAATRIAVLRDEISIALVSGKQAVRLEASVVFH
jgi:hypothetical protein